MQHFPFAPFTLPYPMDGLEPFFPKSLVSDHYQNFYLPQLNELNRLLKNCPSLHSAVLGKLLRWPSLIPSACRRQILESAGGVYCHQFYFFSLCPPRKPSRPDRVEKAICREFESFEKFQCAFQSAALSVLGSGFVWLVMLPKSYRLAIRVSSCYDVPVADGCCPRLCLDMWEHAYCSCFHQKREEYLKAWWCIINWNKVEDRMFSCLCNLL